MSVERSGSERAVAADADVVEHLRRLLGGQRGALTRSQVLYVVYLLGQARRSADPGTLW